MAGYVEMFRLGKTYDTKNGPVVIVEDFNLNMTQGEYICLLGHSGCGKSTVLMMAAGLNPISTGGIVVAGREIDQGKRPNTPTQHFSGFLSLVF